MQHHPLADVFPPLDERAIQELADSITVHGLRDPIVTLEGQILDGRGRFQACENIGAEKHFVPYQGRDPVRFVVEKNLHRRPLNESQRGLIAARIATLTVGHPIAGIPAISQSDAAKLLNVSRDTVTGAKLVLTYASAQNIAQIESGKLRLGIIARALRQEHNGTANNRLIAMTKGKNPARLQRQREIAELWGSVRDALTALTSLPIASDVAHAIRRNDKAGLVNERLDRARSWLEDFARAWEHSNGTKQGNAADSPDAGDGDGAAGMQHDQPAAERQPCPPDCPSDQ